MVREIFLILLLIILTPSTIYSNLYSINHQIPSVINENSNNSPIQLETAKNIETEENAKVAINPDNQDVKEYFQKVAEVPYKADYTSTKPKKPVEFWKDNYGDCDDKSIAFADYLYVKGAQDVKIVIINHESNKYAHACVMWNGRIFDATSQPPLYNIDSDRYFNFLEKQGFKLRVTYPYEPT